MKTIKILIAFASLIYMISCGQEKTDINTTNNNSNTDDLWNNCAFFNKQELDKLDILQQKLNQNNTPENDKPVFEEYITILNLSDKSDQQILNCPPSNSELRQRIMKHFVFLGLRYGQGEFSFVDKPRLASHLEREYFYSPKKKDFLNKGTPDNAYSEADFMLAKYLLGGVIAMQASVKGTSHNLNSRTTAIAQDLSTLKYGRTSAFNRILFEHRSELNSLVANFLAKDQAFENGFSALKNKVSAGIYPMLLKRDLPFYPQDDSEVQAAHESSVVGLSSGAGGGTPLLTGFFGQLSGKTLLFTSGHWTFKKKASVMRQKDPTVFGSQESRLEWIGEQVDMFNFSEELLVPILKAVGLETAQITALQNKLGSPYGGNFDKLRRLLPWSDLAFAIPTQSLLNKLGLKDNIRPIEALIPAPTLHYIGYSIGFGITEDLTSNAKDKGPGQRRYNEGDLTFEIKREFNGLFEIRMVLHTPTSLQQLKYNSAEKVFFSPYSMRFGARCSGAPFITDNKIVGLLQGPWEVNGVYQGLQGVHFSHGNLALIKELITDPRGLHKIPEGDLVNAVQKNMFHDQKVKKLIHDELVKAYSL